MCARYYTSCCIQQNCQMHFIARSQVSSQNALKHTPEYALKYTPNCTRWNTPSLLDCTLPSMLARRSEAHSRACSQVHSPEARHSQSHLTICSHVCSWVLDPETCRVTGARHREAGGGGRNHDVGQYHSLNLIFSAATATRSHHASRSWC